jgi:hypothetical protein
MPNFSAASTSSPPSPTAQKLGAAQALGVVTSDQVTALMSGAIDDLEALAQAQEDQLMPYSSDDLFRLVQDEHTRQVIDLEKRIGTAAVGDSDRLFAELIRRTLTAWTRAFGGPDQAATAGDLLRRILAAARAAIRRILDALAPRATAALEGAWAKLSPWAPGRASSSRAPHPADAGPHRS